MIESTLVQTFEKSLALTNSGNALPSSHSVGQSLVVPSPDLYDTQLIGISPVSFKNLQTNNKLPPLQPKLPLSQATTYSYEY